MEKTELSTYLSAWPFITPPPRTNKPIRISWEVFVWSRPNCSDPTPVPPPPHPAPPHPRSSVRVPRARSSRSAPRAPKSSRRVSEVLNDNPSDSTLIFVAMKRTAAWLEAVGTVHPAAQPPPGVCVGVTPPPGAFGSGVATPPFCWWTLKEQKQRKSSIWRSTLWVCPRFWVGNKR